MRQSSKKTDEEKNKLGKEKVQYYVYPEGVAEKVAAEFKSLTHEALDLFSPKDMNDIERISWLSKSARVPEKLLQKHLLEEGWPPTAGTVTRINTFFKNHLLVPYPQSELTLDNKIKATEALAGLIQRLKTPPTGLPYYEEIKKIIYHAHLQNPDFIFHREIGNYTGNSKSAHCGYSLNTYDKCTLLKSLKYASFIVNNQEQLCLNKYEVDRLLTMMPHRDESIKRVEFYQAMMNFIEKVSLKGKEQVYFYKELTDELNKAHKLSRFRTGLTGAKHYKPTEDMLSVVFYILEEPSRMKKYKYNKNDLAILVQAAERSKTDKEYMTPEWSRLVQLQRGVPSAGASVAV
jgi:hypothetical protein